MRSRRTGSVLWVLHNPNCAPVAYFPRWSRHMHRQLLDRGRREWRLRELVCLCVLLYRTSLTLC